MTLLILYILLAILVSFACSIFEAVLLSVSDAHVALLKSQKHPAGKELDKIKSDIGKPLAAILSLNTIAHTIGAAGAGAQAAAVFGDVYLGLFSAILTLLILVFSEIIPKTIGASYWKQLTPITTYSLKYLIIVTYPLIKLSEFITRRISHEGHSSGLSREEFALMADLSSKEGHLQEQESHFLKNLMQLHQTNVKEAMTPRTVIFSLDQSLTIETFFHKHDQTTFSRIPIYDGDQENITGYVLRNDLLLAKARENDSQSLKNYTKKLPAILLESSLSKALNLMLDTRTHIVLIVDEYGAVQGILTMEDVMETMLGFEIVDEKDKAVDMQQEAKKKWHKKDSSSTHEKW